MIDYNTFKNLSEDEQKRIWDELMNAGIDADIFDLDFDDDIEEDEDDEESYHSLFGDYPEYTSDVCGRATFMSHSCGGTGWWGSKGC